MVNRETGQIFTSFPMHMSCPYCKGNNHTKDVSIRSKLDQIRVKLMMLKSYAIHFFKGLKVKGVENLK